MANSTTVYTLPDGRRAVDVDFGDKTLAAADQGIVQNVTKDGVTLTLPASAAGAHYIIRNGGVKATGGPTGAVSDASALITITGASGDGFSGNAYTAAVNKFATNTKATSKVGDEIEISGSGANTAAAWNVVRVKGVWPRTV